MSMSDWLSPQKRQTRELVAIIEGLARGDASHPIAAKGQGALAPAFSVLRNLAQRSAAAAKEIKTLISDSVDKVETGATLVNQAGHTMEEIVASVKRVTDIMAEISSASAKQSSGIEQINGAITQIDEVTQQNAALVEQAAAAQSLTEQAQTLSQSVSRFRLSSSQGGHNAALPATRPTYPAAHQAAGPQGPCPAQAFA